jgi:hypothetical protein
MGREWENGQNNFEDGIGWEWGDNMRVGAIL